ncbi:glycoside hydrolase family 92 protein [Puteibacter caeruleilacunae]|nr:glycoside hydrolase family 92 protein [Puteibacter caeruleilacunae]
MLRLLIVLSAVLFFSCTQQPKEEKVDYTQFVNPFIGTGGNGNTYPGASMPFGMVQISPDNGIPGWDRISGYFYPDTTIGGFSQTHLTGTGAGDLYDIPVMPVTWPYKDMRKTNPKSPLGPYSVFSHDEEHAEPGYYNVKLKDYNILAELTATNRCGFHRYTFPKAEKASLFIDLNKAMNWDYTLDTKVNVKSNTEIEGTRYSQGWAKRQQLFFVAQFSKPFKSINIDTVSIKKPFKEDWGGTGNTLRLDYTTEDGEQIMMKIGISAVSVEGARKNLEAEITHWDFDAVRAEAKAVWNEQLAKIHIDTDNADEKTIFYTAMYQSMLAPTLFSDVDGKYYGPDYKIHQTDGWDNYSTFSLWDTFRAAHPLYTIMHDDRVNDMVKAMVAFYEQHGVLPVWPLAGNVTGMMIGYHAVPVIADAYLKGIGDFDAEKALEACIASAEANIEGQEYFREMGYIPYELEDESVSKALEYAYDDWCIAVMAKKMGKQDVYEKYIKRAGYYRNFFNEKSTFLHPKDKNGKWIDGFVAKDYTKHFCESNAWQYFFFVPQDIKGLADITGGNDRFEQKLDSMFTFDPLPTDDLPIFSTGMIGQYAHGNEPSHHVGYLYNYIGKPWKTQEIVHKIMKTQYKNSPDGICGNEDCGQMSSWMIFSAMGFYPVNPADQTYVIGTPLVDKAVIKLAANKTFTMRAENLTDENKYIESATLNGKPVTKSYLTHQQIINGGELVFKMSATPNKQLWSKKESYPLSMTK